MLDNLNVMERMLLKRVTSYMKENNILYVGIYLDTNGEPGFNVFNEPVIVLTREQVKGLLEKMPDGGANIQLEKPNQLTQNGNNDTTKPGKQPGKRKRN